MTPQFPHNRFRPTALIAAVVLGTAASLLPADEPRDLRRTVAQHVGELSSSLRSERMRAEQALLDLGPQVLELLPSPEEVPDQATRIAVRQLRVKLERVAAELSVQPSRVVLRGGLGVAEAAARITQQTGNPLKVDGLSTTERERQIAADFDGTPFWDALTELCKQAQLAWDIEADTGTIALHAADPQASPPRAVVTSGAFQISLEPLSRQRGTLRTLLQLQAEPRLRPLFVRIADADFRAGLDNGPLALFNPLAVTELPMTGRDPARFNVLFRAPEAQDPAIDISGRATVHLAAAPVEVRFTEITSNRAVYLRRGGVSVTLKEAKFAGGPTGELNVRLSVAYDTGGPEFESHRTWIYHNEVRLETPDGVLAPDDTGFDTTSQGDGRVELEYRFHGVEDAALKKCQLVYVAPTLLITLPVEFSFTNASIAE